MDNIEFFSEFHYPELCEWFKARKLPPPTFKQLPVNGFIIPDTAAGFVYLTDSEVAILDCFISNPLSTEVNRDIALDLIVKHLESCACVHGAKILICNSQIKAIEDRALSHGFTSTGHYMSFSKGLM